MNNVIASGTYNNWARTFDYNYSTGGSARGNYVEVTYNFKAPQEISKIIIVNDSNPASTQTVTIYGLDSNGNSIKIGESVADVPVIPQLLIKTIDVIDGKYYGIKITESSGPSWPGWTEIAFK